MRDKNKYRVEVKEHNEGSGLSFVYERYEAIIPSSRFDHQERIKIACEACKQYGKNFSCPPYSPTFQAYLGSSKTARVIAIRIPQAFFKPVSSEERYRACFRQARGLLVKELLVYRKKGYLVAGSGACLACPVCAVEEGLGQCRNPDEMIYSLESLGTNLTALTKICFDFELDWSSDEHAADFVCSIGAVFSNENEGYP